MLSELRSSVNCVTITISGINSLGYVYLIALADVTNPLQIQGTDYSSGEESTRHRILDRRMWNPWL
jgi:hypothetical protein